jgi:hypothetical protein
VQDILQAVVVELEVQVLNLAELVVVVQEQAVVLLAVQEQLIQVAVEEVLSALHIQVPVEVVVLV